MAKGLEGVRVLELGGGVSAPLAAKLMADLGAEVVKLEPPGGEPARRRGPFPNGRPDPEASGLFLALNANKRSVVAELGTEVGQATLERLATQADLLVHNFTPAEMKLWGIAFERFAALNPALVMLTITPFGLSGSYRDYAASDLTLIHASGWGWNCPGPGTDPALPPIKPFGSHASIQAALHGATAAMAAYYGALERGTGEHIDLSVQEATAAILGRHFPNYSYGGLVDSRLQKRAYAPNTFFRCRGGSIYLVVLEEDQWGRLRDLIGHPAWAHEGKYANRTLRAEHEEELNGRLAEWFAGQEVEAAFRLCQQNRICACPVYDYQDLLRDAHLAARGFVAHQDHPVVGQVKMAGAPYLLEEPWWALRTPAPALGEANGEVERLFSTSGPRANPLGKSVEGGGDQSGRLPLEGVRVLDFSWVWAGPHATLLLTHLGADVLKVESHDRPDLLRRTGKPPQGMTPGLNRSGTFNQCNQGKQSIAINLTTPAGQELARKLAAECDVVISNFSSGVMEQFGLGSQALRQLNPNLIVCTIAGFGQTGPYREYLGYGQAMVPPSGISAQTGYSGGGPNEVCIAYGDPNGGVYAAFALTAALAAGKRNGGGQTIDLSLWEAMICTGFEGWINHAIGNDPHPPMGNRDPVHAPHNCYRCAGEDEWVAIAVENEAQWQALCAAMREGEGSQLLASDPLFADAAARKSNEDALDAILSGWCGSRGKWEVTERLQAAGVPAFPSISTKELAENPHLGERDFFGRAPHPEVGMRTHLGVPWRLTVGPSGVRGRAPLLGEDSEGVLRQLLGLGREEIVQLWRGGAIG